MWGGILLGINGCHNLDPKLDANPIQRLLPSFVFGFSLEAVDRDLAEYLDGHRVDHATRIRARLIFASTALKRSGLATQPSGSSNDCWFSATGSISFD
jgi:hypothetical protein